MANKIRTSQIVAASGNTLEQELALKLTSASLVGSVTSSLTLPNGDIIKTGAIGASTSIGANGVLNVTVTFATPFPNACTFFDAKLIPATTNDFYGMVALVSLTKTQAIFAVKNGATAQAIASGNYLAMGN
jgi:hypothetical protein